ncbi:MAG: extracellular solute-binding protein [Tabrizicola sp.]|nr:extracellular solute-binding protein [Tabrizicola sp.]
MRLLTLGAALVLTAAPVHAQSEVELFHDKGFWSTQLQAVGDACAQSAGVKIVERPYANAEQYKAFIQASIAGGETPGMFTWWTGSTFEELVSTGQVAPLTDVWAEMTGDGRFQPGAAELFTVDGVPYGVPMVMARWVALYDKRVFEELGIAEPASWDELMAAAEKIKASGRTPFLATTQEGWRGFIWFQELMLRTNPEAYLGLHDGSVAYDSDAVRAAFQMWADMAAKGWFSDPRSVEEVNDFVRGDGVIYLIGEWATGLVTTAGFPEEHLGVFIMPNAAGVAEPSVIVEGGPIVISTAGAGDEATMKALRCWVSNDGANAWGAASGNYIGNDAADAPNAIVAEVNADIGAAGHRAYLRWWEAVPPALQGEMVAELNRFLLDPKMETAESVMSTMQALNEEHWASVK